MKEKIIGILRNKIVIKLAVGILIAIVAIVILANVFSSKPKKYEDKIKDVTKALCSEKKMKSAIEDKIIDVKAAAAWKEADQSAKDFKDEYKKIKKDSDEMEEMEDALKALPENSGLEDVKVKKIKEPKKSNSNSKIYTVSAEFVDKDETYEYSVKFVFYKGKIIDIILKDSKASLFEAAVKLEKGGDDANEILDTNSIF